MSVDHTKIPKPALIMGLGGLIPFLSPPLLVLAGEHTVANQAFLLQTVYGAVILSFLGGVHWGRALSGDRYGPSWQRLTWSVIPSLVGWMIVFSPTVEVVAFGFAAAFTFAFVVDLQAVKHGMFPPWYGKLRKILTIGVLVSMGLTLASSFSVVS